MAKEGLTVTTEFKRVYSEIRAGSRCKCRLLRGTDLRSPRQESRPVPVMAGSILQVGQTGSLN